MSKKIEIDREKLRELYVNRKLGPTEIGKIFGAGRETIRRRLIEYGIPRREPNRNNFVSMPWRIKRNLEYLYIECGYSMREIGLIYKVTKSTILYWLKKFNIDRRGFGATYSKFNNRMYRNRFYLKQQYITLKLSTLQIAIKEKVHKSMIARWLIKFNISRRPAYRYNRGGRQ